jgi:hypothetical protein
MKGQISTLPTIETGPKLGLVCKKKVVDKILHYFRHATVPVNEPFSPFVAVNCIDALVPHCPVTVAVEGNPTGGRHGPPVICRT